MQLCIIALAAIPPRISSYFPFYVRYLRIIVFRIPFSVSLPLPPLCTRVHFSWNQIARFLFRRSHRCTWMCSCMLRFSPTFFRISLLFSRIPFNLFSWICYDDATAFLPRRRMCSRSRFVEFCFLCTARWKCFVIYFSQKKNLLPKNRSLAD